MKKKMLNNYLVSIQGSDIDSERSGIISLRLDDKRKSAKQIVIEDASSQSLQTSRVSSSEQSINEEGLDGFQILEADKKPVKQIYQAIPDQAVIVGLTSSIDDEILEQCFNLGIAQVLNKPLQLSDLSRLISLFVSGE